MPNKKNSAVGTEYEKYLPSTSDQVAEAILPTPMLNRYYNLKRKKKEVGPATTRPTPEPSKQDTYAALTKR